MDVNPYGKTVNINQLANFDRQSIPPLPIRRAESPVRPWRGSLGKDWLNRHLVSRQAGAPHLPSVSGQLVRQPRQAGAVHQGDGSRFTSATTATTMPAACNHSPR